MFFWTFIRESFGCAVAPISFGELKDKIILNKKGRVRHLFLFLCAGALWTVWKTRNDLVFNDKVAGAADELEAPSEDEGTTQDGNDAGGARLKRPVALRKECERKSVLCDVSSVRFSASVLS